MADQTPPPPASPSPSPTKETTKDANSTPIPPDPLHPPPLSSSSSTPPTSLTPDPTTTPNPNPNPNPISNPAPGPPPFVTIQPPYAPSFRPAALPVPLPTAPQFSPLPNTTFQPQGFQVQPPGVGSAAPAPMMPGYAPPPGQPPMRPYAPMPNGYLPMPTHGPPGILRYTSPYPTMVRPAFPQRPIGGAVGYMPMPLLSRPPIPGIRGPFMPPVLRPVAFPSVAPMEKPQTTVYVGKISPTVDNDFMLSLLQLCGAVKSWKRVQDPTNGTLKGFGFCEFDTAEGVLRALRLLSKLSVDGQELMLNVNQATKEYLERYVEKKKESSKDIIIEPEGTEKKEGSASGAEKEEPPKPSVEESKEEPKDTPNKDSHEHVNFGLVTDYDKVADREALEKLSGMIEERLKNKPLPPPPPPPQIHADGGPDISNSEAPARSSDGDSDVDIIKHETREDKNDDEVTNETKASTEHDKPEISSPDRSRRNDMRSRDRERDMKREKERELERYEREREQERAKRERDREYKIREDERRYRARVKEWESREREREHLRKLEREREKEKEQERKWEINDQERESDDGYTKKRKHKSTGEDRKRRLREKEDDLADKLKEDEEIAEAKLRAEEERLHQKQQEEENMLKISFDHETNANDKALLPIETNVETKDMFDPMSDGDDSGHENHNGDVIFQNGNDDESVVESVTSDTRATRKLGFGLVGSGKRTAVPSVFHEEEDEDARKDKKMRPLVPIDYSTEELQATRDTVSPSPNLAAAAEFAKRLANVNAKEDRPDAEKERSRRPHDRHSHHRDRDRNDESTRHRTRDESRTDNVDRDKDRERERERGQDKVKTQDNRKLLDAKQLIDTIPKTKDELFSYEINWAIYDKNELHEKMRPWISKKITEFLGEEETTLVQYIVSSTQEHVKAPEMLERLQVILDDEAEMFVLKMWRMLIFEIKRVETGLASKTKA